MYWRYFKGLKNQSSWEKVCDKKLLDFMLVKGSSKQRKTIGWLALCGMLGAVISAAGPAWQKKEVPSLTPENPIMLVLNLSSDIVETDLKPSRLDRAKYKIIDLLDAVKTPQAGLIVYSAEPFLITPITDDARLIKNLLPEVTQGIMPLNGDRLDRALEMAADRLKNGGYTHGNIVVLAPDAGQRFDLALSAAKKAFSEGYRVSVIGINKAPSERLKLVAENGGGHYASYTAGNEDIKNMLPDLEPNSDQLKISENLRSQWLDAGYFLVIIPLLCCLYFFRKGILAGLLLISFTAPAQAGFFLNNNQEGYRAFQHEDYQKAAEKFENPQWKASSQYRLGDYQKAYENFSQANDTTSLYNQGNALAKGGKIEEAIKKYEEVLKIESNHEDAKFNLEYLKKQQQNKQSQNNQDKQNQDQNKDQEKQRQNSGSNNNDEQDQQEQSSSEQNQAEQQHDQKNQDQQEGQRQQDNESNKQQQQPDQGQKQKEQPNPENKTAAEQQKSDEQKYDEEAQARAQQYREIPENPGGLLKAFIYKEYMKKRYEK